MRCSRFGDGGRIHAILNGEPLEEVYCFKCLESQDAADGGYERDAVHRMNEEYRAWGVVKSVRSNKGNKIKIYIFLFKLKTFDTTMSSYIS